MFSLIPFSGYSEWYQQFVAKAHSQTVETVPCQLLNILSIMLLYLCLLSI